MFTFWVLSVVDVMFLLFMFLPCSILPFGRTGVSISLFCVVCSCVFRRAIVDCFHLCEPMLTRLEIQVLDLGQVIVKEFVCGSCETPNDVISVSGVKWLADCKLF